MAERKGSLLVNALSRITSGASPAGLDSTTVTRDAQAFKRSHDLLVVGRAAQVVVDRGVRPNFYGLCDAGRDDLAKAVMNVPGGFNRLPVPRQRTSNNGRPVEQTAPVYTGGAGNTPETIRRATAQRVLAGSEHWSALARCGKADPEALFVPGAAQNRAKELCRGCVVWRDCRADALQEGIEDGVWGGLTERERRALIRRSKPGEIDQLASDLRHNSKIALQQKFSL